MTYLPEDVENSYGGRAGDNILGHPYGSFYGYVADGIFKTQEEAIGLILEVSLHTLYRQWTTIRFLSRLTLFRWILQTRQSETQ